MAGSSIAPAAGQLQREGVKIYSVGAGPRYKQAEVLALTSYADYVRPYGFSELPRRYFNPGNMLSKFIFIFTLENM